MVNSSCRPNGQTGGVTTTTKSLWAWSLLALWATSGQAQKIDHVHAIPHYQSHSQSQTAPQSSIASARVQAGRSPPEIPLLHDVPTPKFRNTEKEDSHLVRYQDALAPAHRLSAVEAPLAQSTESAAGLALGQQARLLRDWEAEDIILLSTIDGALHARDRKSGQPLWTIEMPDDPMVRTVHLTSNHSGSEEALVQEDWNFVIEPSPEGQLFALFKDAQLGLIRAEKTVKKMAAEVPSFFSINGIRLAVTSEQKSKSYTIDIASGEILNQFPKARSGQHGDVQPRCRRRNELELEDPACRPGRTIRIGRNEYKFTIAEEQSGLEVAEIGFSEWVPNTNDRDLQDNYRKSFDGYDIQSTFQGRFMIMDYEADDRNKARTHHMLGSPVARVFDIVRSRDDHDESADLVILSRPMDLPVASKEVHEWKTKQKHSQRVFVNQFVDSKNTTHWYAMSDYGFPGITLNAPMAKITRYHDDPTHFHYNTAEDLIGVHLLSRDPTAAAPVRLTISDTEHNNPQAIDDERQVSASDDTQVPAQLSVSTPSVPVSTVIVVLLTWTIVLLGGIFLILPSRTSSAARIAVLSWIATLYGALLPQKAKKYAMPVHPIAEAPHSGGGADPVVDVLPTLEKDIKQSTEGDNAGLETPTHSRTQSTASGPTSPRRDERTGDADDNDSDAESDDDPREANAVSSDGLRPKKKTKRGKRGGRKNKKKTMDPTTFDEKPNLALEQHLDNSLLQVGTLKIDTREDNCLGRGSNGTTVYPGLFNGREVAVKRLIKSTNDLAKKEIQHLMSSDENPHVIRFHTHEESRDFFYIALDRFTTSLDQFIEHPSLFPALISGTKGFDVKDCLRQITYGVQHLHSLKLVHRDIKPQNVLVKPVRSNRPSPEMPPLLFVISDFGLCKPLDEGAMSTFAPTANHTAAGTTGWRAPELLVSPKDLVAAPNAQSSNSVSTIHSRDGTVIDPPTGRRATKAIDIFSLGCVYYYVMTQGGHPFDKGGSSLGRDLNIKENNMTTELLQLHKYEYDADDLILQMLQHNPKDRPDCSRVLRHPYFWLQEQKLDFVCLVSDCYEGEKNSIANIHDPNAVRTQSELAVLDELAALECLSPNVIGIRHDGTVRDFLSALPKSFISEMGKQRKYTGTKMIDLLRVIRNKKNHFKDLPIDIKEMMLKHADGQLAGYYQFWAERFPSLLINCHALVIERNLVEKFGLEKWYDHCL